ncbi:MAG: hypothetical protein AAF206_00810 [Bacteroidota bacterium]
MGLLDILGFRNKPEPKIITDFSLVDGGLYLDIINASDEVALAVRHSFSTALPAQGGSRNLADLPLMDEVPFMAPRKHIRIFMDPLEVFLHFWQEASLRIDIRYTNQNGKIFRSGSVHNLRILDQLPPTSRVDFYHPV